MRSWIHDPLWVLASFGAVWGLLLFARASQGWSADARRRLLHMGVGSWVLVVTPRFHHMLWALVPPVAFIAINASRLLRDRFPDLADRPAAARGLWTFPLGVAVTYLLFWEDESRAAILAGVAALTFGDPAAAWVGRRWGQRRYRGFGSGRSLEGSLAFLAVAGVTVGVTAAYGNPDVHALRFAVGCGAAGAAAEAVTPAGWDNVSIPVVVAGAYGMLA